MDRCSSATVYSFPFIFKVTGMAKILSQVHMINNLLLIAETSLSAANSGMIPSEEKEREVAESAPAAGEPAEH